ncbi:MAG: DNA topoisomerase [Huintestinicola sp.]|uniref:DNA topoisomerase n=1 Tax=Huintestinicola sp. TaxID=2981661 RepID=UPI003F036D81
MHDQILLRRYKVYRKKSDTCKKYFASRIIGVNSKLRIAHFYQMVCQRPAGRARDIADWLIGNNLTVAATKRFGGYKELLSVGRVQTPTLALVVEREKEILNHTKSKFWRIMAGFTTVNGDVFEAEYIEGKITKLEDAEKKLSECGNADGIVAEVNTKHKSESAPLLFNATQLQIAANKKFGWDSDKTTKVMQDLYEHKLMTYPRTSSEHLTEAMMSEVSVTIGKLINMPEYSKYAIPKDRLQCFSKTAGQM